MSIPRIITIIPARGGSKGLPGKSLIPLGGVPLIGWSIKAAKEAQFNSQIVVSTDSPEIARVSEELGATVPCLRPDDISGDEANVEDAISHTLAVLRERGQSFDLLSVLFLTHPFRSPRLIDRLVEMCLAGAEQAITAHRWVFDPREWFLLGMHEAEPLAKNHLPVPPFEVIHEFNLGNVSWVAGWRGSYPRGARVGKGTTELPKGIKRGKSFHLIDDLASCIDIDTPADLREAERLLGCGAVNWRPGEGGDYIAEAAPHLGPTQVVLEVASAGAGGEVFDPLLLESLGSPEEMFQQLKGRGYPCDEPLVLRSMDAKGLGIQSIHKIPDYPAIKLDTTRALGSGLRQRKVVNASWQPLTVKGLLAYERGKGWINELSGDLITGRQHCPPVYRWIGVATFPALNSFDAEQHKRWRILN